VLYQAVLIVNSTRVHLFALLFILLVLVLLAVLVGFGLVVIFRAYARNGRMKRPFYRLDEPPELILARRFASGAIGEEEYHRRIDALKSQETPPRA